MKSGKEETIIVINKDSLIESFVKFGEQVTKRRSLEPQQLGSSMRDFRPKAKSEILIDPILQEIETENMKKCSYLQIQSYKSLSQVYYQMLADFNEIKVLFLTAVIKKDEIRSRLESIKKTIKVTK
jgi:hypothetical protein